VPSILAYHRPTNLDEAAEYLSKVDHWALAGGTAVVPEARKQRSTGIEMVDLQALGLDAVEVHGDRLKLGAMIRLGDLGDDDRVPDLIKDAARRELPSAMRNQATIGGTLAEADPESVLLAALLTHEARIEIHNQPDSALGEYLGGDRKGLIVGVTINPSGRGSIASTGRTPADTPIVAALARSTDDGPRLVLTGVAATPIEVDPSSPTAELNPTGDFRGSATYRVHLAAVLSARAISEVQ